MAKIHVRGGSDLSLRFVDDDETPLEVRLEPASKDEYWVITKDSKGKDKKLQTYQETGKNIFRETNPDKKSCEVHFMQKQRPVA